MITNYFKLALRNLAKHRLFSAINIFGLSLSMSVCLLILMLLQEAYRYDNFHPDSDRVYRINTEAIRKNGGSESYASTPYPLASVLKQRYSQVENSCRFMRSFNSEASCSGKILPVQGLLTEPSFFQMFGFQLLEGNAATALKEPFSIVLTQKLADKFFPRESALGKTMELRGIGAFQVTGILADFPGKTHFEFEALGSASSIPAMEASGTLSKLSDDWTDYYQTYSFIKLAKGASWGQTESDLAAVSSSMYSKLTLESRDADYRFYLQPLEKITPGPILSNSMGRALPAMLLWFLTALGAIIMLSACFNYTNLTLSRALSRAKEIGVRKVIGASRQQVIGQLLTEGVLTSLIALGGGWLLMKLVQPGFNSLSFAAFTDLSVKADAMTALWFLGFAVVIGIIAGLLPALTMSRVSPTAVLRKLESIKLFKRVGLRKVLLVSQFTVSLVFIILVTVIARQIGFVMSLDYGFNTSRILNIKLQGVDPEKLIPAFAALPGVENISAASHNMGTFEDSSDDVRCSPNAEPEAVRDYSVDRHFAENMGLTFIAGENFPENPPHGKESFLIVNERFVEKYNLGTPAEAIGKRILIGDSTSVILRGVIKDFLYKPANYALEPLMLRNDPDYWRLLNIKLAAGNPASTIAALQGVWSELVPEREMVSEFYEETIEENYANLNDILIIISFFGFLGIVIAAMGLLGMATYTVETRTKEIGVRKVMGASILDLVLLLSRSFLWLLGIAAVLAIPIGWFLGTQMLNIFAHRIELGLGVILPGILLLLLVAVLTIGTQTLRGALGNPVTALRDD